MVIKENGILTIGKLIKDNDIASWENLKSSNC